MAEQLELCVNKQRPERSTALGSCRTCGRADTQGAFVELNGFKCGIQFHYEPVEIIQGNVKLRVTVVVAGLHEAGMLMGHLLCRVQTNRLTHSEDVVGHHVGHAFSCRHHVRSSVFRERGDRVEICYSQAFFFCFSHILPFREN